MDVCLLLIHAHLMWQTLVTQFSERTNLFPDTLEH